MRPGTNSTIIDALAAAGITTAWLARFDFASGPMFVWTGVDRIQPTATGDSLLDGNIFEPLANGIVVQVGDNSFSYSGSDQLDIVLGVSSSLTSQLSQADYVPSEWQTRPATIWRAIMVPPSGVLSTPAWLFRRIRTGAMDGFEWGSDAQTVTIKLTVESHASLISDASGMTYQNQKSIDPSDTSQDFAAAIATGGSLNSTTVQNPVILPGGGVLNLPLGRLL